MRAIGVIAAGLCLLHGLAVQAAPVSVTVAGSLQSELGCPGDWQPDCQSTHLVYDANDDVWQAVFVVPAGSYEYKAAINDSWAENYGADGVPNGSNIALTLGTATSVKFYYDDKTHWITDDVNSVIAVLTGSFQSELGCSGDWDPACLRSWLEDVDGDGMYSFITDDLPAGSYDVKVMIDESFAENYGAGGVLGGANISFFVPSDWTQITFLYNANTHLLQILVDGASAVPEPATLALLGIGLAGLALRRRKYAV